MTGDTQPVRGNRQQGRIAMACIALLSMVLSAIAVAVPARAADNPNIVITDLTLTRTNNQGTGDWPGKLTVGQHARLDFKWDASNADVKAGDSFTIDLGTYFENLEYPKTVPMTVTNNGEQIEIGSCDLTHTQVVCTFSDKVDELKAAGFDAFRGTGVARLRAIKATTSETADITTNNVVSVDLPETGGIGEAVGEAYRIYNFHKWAGGLWSEKGMTWGIDFGTKYVGEKTGTTLDGSSQTIVMTDNLGEGMEFRAGDYLKDWVLYYRGTNGDATMQQTRLTDASGADAATGMGDFDLSVEVNGKTATITATGPFKPDSNYQVTFPVTFSGGKVTRGVIYGNSATLNGTAVQVQDSRYFVESFSITVEMAAGFGGFDITKVVSGTGAASVPAGTEFTVDVSYELPAVASTYENWQAPGTLNADGKTGTAQMKAVVGQKVPFNGTFPKGTKITLSEDPNSETASGLSWDEPVFTVGNSETNTLLIGDQTSTAVTLTNTTAPRGTFVVKKSVTGSAEAVSKEFSFDYSCSDGVAGTLKVKGDGNAVMADKSFALGTTCTVTEDASSAQLAEYSLEVPAPQTVEISDATSPVEVSFANDYKRLSGGFTVAKTVAGDAADLAPASFDFEYACMDAAGKETASGMLTVQNGQSVSVEDIPTGTCTVSEKSAGVDGAQLATKLMVDGEAVDGDTATINVTDGSAVAVAATNTYTRERGSFSVAKKVAGDFTPAAGESFTVNYTCDDVDATSGS
ncbi:MAG: peptidase, partial [Actinomycetaceae bacterium]|nr:peptidase [Actinomycetaceae bacterium]